MLNLPKIQQEDPDLFQKILLNGMYAMNVVNAIKEAVDLAFDLDKPDLIEEVEQVFVKDYQKEVTALYVKHFKQDPNSPDFDVNACDEAPYDTLRAFYEESSECVKKYIEKAKTFVKTHTA